MSSERPPDSGISVIKPQLRVSVGFHSSDSHLFHVSFVALMVAVSYYAASKIGFAFTPAHQAISTFWPPNAVLLSALLLVRTRMWWIVILAVLPAHFLIQLGLGVPALTALGWFITNTSEALIGALCISHFKKQAALFESVRGVF